MKGWKQVGKLIKLDRTERNLSQDGYAKLIGGISQQSIARWEKGNTIDDDYWEAILAATGIDIGSMVESGEDVVLNVSGEGIVQTVSGVTGGNVAGRSININNGSTAFPSPTHQYAWDLLLKADEQTAKEVVQLLLSKGI